MPNHEFLKRAFALADSGDVRTIDDVRLALLREGYSNIELSQLSGKALSQQLHARMTAAQSVPKPNSGTNTS
jgi:hypothetical protein